MELIAWFCVLFAQFAFLNQVKNVIANLHHRNIEGVSVTVKEKKFFKVLEIRTHRIFAIPFQL